MRFHGFRLYIYIYIYIYICVCVCVCVLLFFSLAWSSLGSFAPELATQVVFKVLDLALLRLKSEIQLSPCAPPPCAL